MIQESPTFRRESMSTGVLVIVCEILFCLYKWFGIYPVIFSIGIILILIGLSISGDNRL